MTRSGHLDSTWQMTSSKDSRHRSLVLWRISKCSRAHVNFSCVVTGLYFSVICMPQNVHREDGQRVRGAKGRARPGVGGLRRKH